MLGDIIIEADFDRIAADAAPDADAVFQTMVIDDPRHFGCLIVDPDGFIERIVEKPPTGDYRLALAKGAGADLTVNVASTRIKDAQRSLGMREGFDVGLEMSGAPSAVAEMLANLNHGGKVAMLGLPKDPYPIDWGRVITHMITLKGIYGREMFETWYLMSSMLASSEVFKAAVSSVITHRFPADQWADGFAAARSGDCGKVVLDWS